MTVAPPAGPQAPPTPGGLGPAGPEGPPGSGSKGGGFDWNPVSWIGSTADWTAHQVDQTIIWGGSQIVKVAGWAAGAVAGITKAVFHFVNVGLHVVEGLFARLVGVLHKMIAAVFVLAHDAQSLANGAVDWIHHSADWLMGQLGTWGKNFYDSTVHPAIEAAVKGLKDAGNVAHGIITGLQHTVTWIQKTALPAAEATAHDALKIGDEALKKAEGFVTTDVFDKLSGQVAGLATEVSSLAAQIPSDLVTILDDVVKASEWIIWMAEHTFEDLEALMTGYAPSTSVGAVEKKEAAVPADLNAIDEVLKGFGL